MKNESVNLKGDKLFPFHFHLLGIVFMITGLASLLSYPYLAPLFLLLGGAILSAYRGIEFDSSNKSYREYYSFLFLKFGSWEKLGHMEKVFINSINVSQKIYTMVTTGTTVRNVMYNGYLKLANGSKIYLMSKRDKNALTKKLTKISDFFKLEIVDNTL